MTRVKTSTRGEKEGRVMVRVRLKEVFEGKGQTGKISQAWERGMEPAMEEGSEEEKRSRRKRAL